jgi:anti-sigma B factor antagonist/stage II sporulation protein AA (anti-sigma F factor antagonist)
MTLETFYGEAVILAPSGRIDLTNAEEFRDSLLAAVERAQGTLIVDFAGIDYISSAGLRSLMIALQAAKKKNLVIGIAALRPMVAEIFTISRFHLVFPLFDTVRDGLAKLAPASLPDFDAVPS